MFQSGELAGIAHNCRGFVHALNMGLVDEGLTRIWPSRTLSYKIQKKSTRRAKASKEKRENKPKKAIAWVTLKPPNGTGVQRVQARTHQWLPTANWKRVLPKPQRIELPLRCKFQTRTGSFIRGCPARVLSKKCSLLLGKKQQWPL